MKTVIEEYITGLTLKARQQPLTELEQAIVDLLHENIGLRSDLSAKKTEIHWLRSQLYLFPQKINHLP